MITWMLAALAAAAEVEGDGSAVLPEDLDGPVSIEEVAPMRIVKEPKVRMLPLRVDTRVAFRQDADVAPVVELGAQLARTEKTTFDLNLGYTAGHQVMLDNWIPRSFLALEATGDAMLQVNRLFSIGPTVGGAMRHYRQQWQLIDTSWVPIAGMKVQAAIVRARTWSVALSSRWTTDLALTRMVLETNEVRHLHPFEGQVGLKVNLGHGIAPSDRAAADRS